ncbi:MAG TPA: 2-amino-4-hydroxy-6-hydroxymethyldihydropteridine diphosphokinase [Solirubrobacterales bacterium]|nr:2-amino-4-hydroxy-6-hydroxymethyldihydropteridine diphosphokinase [Solirubrobacterales bacterium]
MNPRESRRGFLGLGSNQGDRRAHLRAAIEALGASGAEVSAASSVYETAPVGEYPGEQQDFLNMVVEIHTELGPHELLELCKEIEAGRGRDFDAPRHGPRPLDLDILLLGGEEVDDARLRIPHGALTERRFVLDPLAEIAPREALPGGVRASEARTAVSDQRAERVGPLG